MNINYIITDKNNTQYNIHIATTNELDDILKFQDYIIKNMERSDFFCPLTKQEFLDPMENNGVYLLYNNDKIIALAVLNTNPRKEIIEEYEFDDNNGIAIFDSIMVLPEYRGNKIQKQFTDFIFLEAQRMKCNKIVATVHPDNIYSLNNFYSSEYKLLKTINIHNGTRYILTKDID